MQMHIMPTLSSIVDHTVTGWLSHVMFVDMPRVTRALRRIIETTVTLRQAWVR